MARGYLKKKTQPVKTEKTTSEDVMNLHVPVNLLGLPVATQQTTQDPHATHPGKLLRHTSVGCSLSLTWGEVLDGYVMLNLTH